jgi:phenylalanine-4-hydroxylase
MNSVSALVDKQTGPGVLAYGGQLAADHPGFRDAGYRARRAEVARLAAGYRPGCAITPVPYAPEEHELWAACHRELRARHERLACEEFLTGADAVQIPADHVSQLDELSARLRPLTGFSYEPVPGLVSPRDFYRALGDGRFMSTQYIRHHSVPYYTPEPDVIHEIVGHANQLASPRFAAMYRKVGDAAFRVTSDEAMQFLSRVFWFTVEFGVVREGGELKAYGAGILSSFGELEAFRAADVRPFDLVAMGCQPYDITRYQPVLFAADSVEQLTEEFGAFLDVYDDELFARLTAAQRAS